MQLVFDNGRIVERLNLDLDVICDLDGCNDNADLKSRVRTLYHIFSAETWEQDAMDFFIISPRHLTTSIRKSITDTINLRLV